jgi:hypothetical protein
MDVFWFTGDIECLWGSALHAKREFKTLDTGGEFVLRGMVLQVHSIELG